MENIDLFLAQNPWQVQEKFTVESFIERDVFRQALGWLQKDEIITLTGPRQAGKTTLLLKLVEHLLSESGCPGSSIYYFNFDQEELGEEFGNPQKLLSFIKSRSEHRKYYLFLDEVQRLKEPGLYLKVLYDLPQRPLKMVVSGSSSLLLKAKTKEHLTGRQIEFYTFPLSFKEMAAVFGFRLPADHSTALQDLLGQTAVYGGYPRPFQESNSQIKQQLLSQLYRDYVKKDIRDFAGVEEVAGFNKLTGLLAYQVGNLVEKNELAAGTQLDARTVGKYLEVLEQTFVVTLVPPYFTNRRKEIVKTPKVYYLDNGLRNARLNDFTNYELRPDRGALFENTVLTELFKNCPPETQVHYWRTQAGAEVDFVLVKGQKLVPVEVKTAIKDGRTQQGLKSFIEGYKPEQAFVVSESFSGEGRYRDTAIKFIPFDRLLEIFDKASSVM